MKKVCTLLLGIMFVQVAMAQNEGRFGVFAGMNRTMLNNADDKAYGDLLPTYKPTVGIDAGYHFTLFKRLPAGLSAQFAYNQMGQNYRGFYADSTSYYAYNRLNYMRLGMAVHFGTNMRRQVALTFSGGMTYGFLTGYQDKYELIRYNNERLILEINNTEVTYKDTFTKTGTLSKPLYNNTDMSVFGTLGLDFLAGENMVFGVNFRFDYGMDPVETSGKMNINYTGEQTTTQEFLPYNVKVKYRGPTDVNIVRAQTTNLSYGIFLSVKYRLYDHEKSEFWYRERNR